MIVVFMGNEHSVEWLEVDAEHLLTKVRTTINEDAFPVHF
jgi:hypothetical protein